MERGVGQLDGDQSGVVVEVCRHPSNSRACISLHAKASNEQLSLSNGSGSEDGSTVKHPQHDAKLVRIFQTLQE